MRSLLVVPLAAALLAECHHAHATVIATSTNGLVTLEISDPVPVGTGAEDLVSVVLTARTSSTDPLGVLTAFTGTSSDGVGRIGANRSLHHEQFATGPPITINFPTPTLMVFAGLETTVDSHFLVVGGAATVPPSEEDFLTIFSGEPGDFPSGSFTGFGAVLSGDFEFDAGEIGTSVAIAKLVSRRGAEVDYDITILAADVTLSGEFGTGSFFVGVPEPSTALLGGLTLVVLAALRRAKGGRRRGGAFAPALAAALLAGCHHAHATVVATSTNGLVTLEISDPVPVGTGVVPDLVSVVLTATTTSADPAGILIGFAGNIGENRSLHHEQFRLPQPFEGDAVTPTASFAGDSSVDSHFLVLTSITGFPPWLEDPGSGFFTPSGEPGDFGAGEFVGFGPSLFGDFEFDADEVGTSVALAQLVTRRGAEVDYDITILAAGGALSGAFGTGSFIVGVPEPSTALLGGLALVGLAYQRYRRP